MAEIEMSRSPETNWSSFLDQVVRDYNTFPAKGIAHGLQKDAVQNGWGARVRDHNWEFEFKLERLPNGKLILTMTDQGTYGLVGNPHYFDTRTKTDEEIPEKERLARFESMFFSGGSSGVGLFGRGKLLFNAASQQKLIFYDSLTADNNYRLNMREIKGSAYNYCKHALEGEFAKKKLLEWTYSVLKPLARSGTRIIIVDPIPEVVDAIHSGAFLRAIEETWWEIILKFGAKIYVKDEKNTSTLAQVPIEYAFLPKENEAGWRVFYKDNVEVKVGTDIYKIKHLHFLLPPKNKHLSEDLQGVNVHRKGMKVGALQLEIPQEIADRFFGYVQLSSDLEDFIAETENTTHYGFAMRKSPAKELRNVVRENFETFMQQLGYGPNSQEQNEKAKRLLERAKEELDNILRQMGVPSFTTGRSVKSDFSISVIGLSFPNNTNYMNIGEGITGFKYKITNRSIVDKKIFLEVTTRAQNCLIETILAKRQITVIGSHPYETEPLALILKAGVYPKGKKVSCTAVITDEKQNILCEKSFHVYIDLTPTSVEQFASISLCSADWPHEKSRRVDFNEKITNLMYEVENLTPIIMKAKLKVGTIWADEGERIDDSFQLDLTLTPFETKSFVVPEILLSKEKYSEVEKGKMYLRCHAVALEETSLWENRRKLDVNDVIFYLNKDPGYGFFEDPEYTSEGPDKPRSFAKSIEGGRWKMWVNNTHPAFQAVEHDSDLTSDYAFEEMARQTVFVLLQVGDSNTIKKLLKLSTIGNLDDLTPSELLRTVAYPITDQILSAYYNGR